MRNLYKEYHEYQKSLGKTPDFMKKYLILEILIRLQHITLLCGMENASKWMYHFKMPYITRFDHSLNDAKITWNLTQDKRMALASLFHDVASPTWSHVVDYMNKDFIRQESTEEKTEEIIRSSKKLLEYLKSDGVNVYDIIDFKKYSIVDLPRPYLCADRVENTISSAFAWTGNITLEEAKFVIDNLQIKTNENGKEEISLRNIEAAEILIDLNDEINNLTHTKEDYYMMIIASQILKRCIEIRLITYDQLFTLTEPELLRIIKENLKKDSILSEYWYTYTNAKTVPDFEMPEIKNKTLTPLVNGVRYRKK